MTTAIKSLYGSGTSHKKKRRAKAIIGDGARPQQVFSPDWILDAVRQAFGGPIGFDPCAAENPDDHVAQVNFSGLGPNRLRYPEEVGEEEFVMGELAKWPLLPTYINPPFNNLEPWLRAGLLQSIGGCPVVILTPVRTHRSWFWWHLGDTTEIVFLNYNVRFKGHQHAFPAPLCLVSVNCFLPRLGDRETYRLAPSKRGAL